MATAEELEAVAPLIDHQIEGYDGAFAITERPKVGSLALPVGTCTLIYRVLGYALYSFMMRRSSEVKVKCERTTPGTLVLEVMADHAVPPVNEVRASSMLADLNQMAHDLDGEIVTGGEMRSDKPSLGVFFRLTVPIPA